MEYARPLHGKSRRGESSSATSRKNKLQRCSRCGGLGHKSRTCDQSMRKDTSSDDLDSVMPADRDDYWSEHEAESPTHDPDWDPMNDQLAVLAAYNLLTLSNANTKPSQVQMPLPMAQHERSGYLREMEFARMQQFASGIPRWAPGPLLMY